MEQKAKKYQAVEIYASFSRPAIRVSVPEERQDDFSHFTL